jgi:uncharacterized protein (TIGR00266 family)
MEHNISGHDSQCVQVTLAPGESVVSEAGALIYMDANIALETILGDGSPERKGVLGAIAGAGARLLGGSTLFMTRCTNEGSTPQSVGFAAPTPGMVVPLRLGALGGEIIAQKYAFLCGEQGTMLGIALQKKLGTLFFGGEGLVMQRLTGSGMVFLHAGGTLIERTLNTGEVLRVDTGCVVAYQKTVQFNVEAITNVKTLLFGGEGIFFATLTGPGKVWLQSMPFGRTVAMMSQQIMDALPKNRK